MSNISDFLGGGGSGGSIATNELGLVSGSVDLNLSNYGVFEAEANAATTFNIIGLSSTGRRSGWFTLKSTDFSNISFSSNVEMQPLKFGKDVGDYSYNNVDSNLNISSVGGTQFNIDGTKIYNYGVGTNLRQWSLSTPWDITTMTFDGVVDPSGVFDDTFVISPNGKLLFVYNNNNIIVRELSIPYDIVNSTITLVSSKDVENIGSSTPIGCDISNDGKILYMCKTEGYIYSYYMDIAWDVDTIGLEYTFNTVPFSQLRGIRFNNDGSRFYVTDSINAIYQYELSIPWDLSTATQTGNYFALPFSVAGVCGYNPQTQKIYVEKSGDGPISELDPPYTNNSGIRMYYIEQIGNDKVLLTPYMFEGV